jgi:hypothetical protein
MAGMQTASARQERVAAMERVTGWQSSPWARWLGWTVVFTVVLSVWGVSLVPQSPLAALFPQSLPSVDGEVIF